MKPPREAWPWGGALLFLALLGLSLLLLAVPLPAFPQSASVDTSAKVKQCRAWTMPRTLVRPTCDDGTTCQSHADGGAIYTTCSDGTRSVTRMEAGRLTTTVRDAHGALVSQCTYTATGPHSLVCVEERP